MRLTGATFYLLCMALASLALEACSGSDIWTPDAKTIAKLESVIKIPKGRQDESTFPLNKYRRYYWGTTKDGMPMINGVLMLAGKGTQPPGVYIVREKELQISMDGGCGIVYLNYDPKAVRIVEIRCGGYA
jgi:hypothetical protein